MGRAPPPRRRAWPRGWPVRWPPRCSARIPAADLDERDPDYIRESLPRLWLLATLCFRAQVRGLENIPDKGPVLLVGNHSGGNVTPDTLVFTLAFNTYFGVERRFFQLAHNLVLADARARLPAQVRYRRGVAGERGQGPLLGRRAARLPGRRLRGAPTVVGVGKVDFGGRKGFIRLALSKNVPIVPVVAIGGQETALFLSRGEWLARLLRLDKLFRLKVLPISLAFPWGLNIGDMLGHFPLPSKISIQVLPPIHLRQEFGRNPDVDEVYDAVITRMQAALDTLAADRRLPVIG